MSEKCSVSLVITEKVPLHTRGMVIIPRKQKMINVGEDLEKLEPSYVAGGIVNWFKTGTQINKVHVCSKQ